MEEVVSLVRLDTEGITQSNVLFENVCLKIVKEIHEFKYLKDFLLNIFEQTATKQGETPALLEFIHQNPLFEEIDRKKAEGTVGLGFPGHIFYLRGAVLQSFRK